jgi:hypothetical protein
MARAVLLRKMAPPDLLALALLAPAAILALMALRAWLDQRESEALLERAARLESEALREM